MLAFLVAHVTNLLLGNNAIYFRLQILRWLGILWQILLIYQVFHVGTHPPKKSSKLDDQWFGWLKQNPELFPTFDFSRIHKIHPPDDDSDVPCSTSNPNHSLNTPKKNPHTGRT